MVKTVDDFELVNHGAMWEDYFQGCGRGGYEEVVTGIGHNPDSALNDLLDLLGERGIETNGLKHRINTFYGRKSTPKTPKAKGHNCYYYLSLRYNLATPA
jgi:hypothetical protein